MKPFLSDSKFLKYKGFEPCDEVAVNKIRLFSKVPKIFWLELFFDLGWRKSYQITDMDDYETKASGVIEYSYNMSRK